jgi:hypothetical protein
MPDSLYGIPKKPDALYVENLVDIPPTNPTPWDDEFDGSVLNPKWTIWNQISNETVRIHDSLVTLDARYDVYQRVFSLIQPAPSGAWKFRTKILVDSPTYNYTGIGMIARRITDADKSLYLMLLFNSSQGIAMTSIWGLTITGTAIAAGDTDLYNMQAMKLYMEMEYDLTNIIFRVSSTGTIYSQVWSVAASAWTGIPEWVGINLHPLSSATSDPNFSQVMSCDWFRRIL